jgi:two-component system cell cycle sensor histidine kinase/response regulator CckA
MSPGVSRIIIADDEPALLRVMVQYLRRLGYEVSGFSSGREALEAFEAEPASFSLVIADATLEDMPAAELLSRTRALAPGLGFLVSSGYPVDIAGFPEDLRANTVFLQKPFTPKMLAETVAGIIGNPERG